MPVVTGGGEWTPLTPEQIDAAAPPFLAEGFLKVNKHALHTLTTELAAKTDGDRDLLVIMFLLNHAAFNGKRLNPLEGTVIGNDTELADLAGMNRQRFKRAAAGLVRQRYIAPIDPDRPRGYRFRKSVWKWLGADKPVPNPPGVGNAADPFG